MPEAVHIEVEDLDIFPAPTVLAVCCCYFSRTPLCWIHPSSCMALLCRLSSSALYSFAYIPIVACTVEALACKAIAATEGTTACRSYCSLIPPFFG